MTTLIQQRKQHFITTCFCRNFLVKTSSYQNTLHFFQVWWCHWFSGGSVITRFKAKLVQLDWTSQLELSLAKLWKSQAGHFHWPVSLSIASFLISWRCLAMNIYSKHQLKLACSISSSTLPVKLTTSKASLAEAWAELCTNLFLFIAV